MFWTFYGQRVISQDLMVSGGKVMTDDAERHGSVPGSDGHVSENARRQAEWRQRHPERHAENQRRYRERKKDD